MSHAPQPLWPMRSHISIFVRALHLLDLDLLEDWPGVTSQVFNSKATLQQRTRCVEWSLYRLFELFDHRTCADKLKPFFPPNTQLQSRNLRAALLRQLTLLKTNGFLGPSIVIRKTMFDECKGDKFEELIAAFAMLVLRSKPGNPETKPPLPKPQHVIPLMLANRVSLQANLRERYKLRRQAAETWHTARQNLDSLNDREGKLRARHTELGQVDVDVVEKVIFTDWIGNNQWIDEVLHTGKDLDSDAGSISLSSNVSLDEQGSKARRDFEKAFQKAQSQLFDLREMLDNLNQVVKPPLVQDASKLQNNATAIDLNQHESITPDYIHSTATAQKMTPEYDFILDSLKKDLYPLEKTSCTKFREEPVARIPGESDFFQRSLIEPSLQSQTSKEPGQRATGASPKLVQHKSNSSLCKMSSSPWVPDPDLASPNESPAGVEAKNQSLNHNGKPRNLTQRTRASLAAYDIRESSEGLVSADSFSPDHILSLPSAQPETSASREGLSLLERTRQSISMLSDVPRTPNKHKKAKSTAEIPGVRPAYRPRRSSTQSAWIPDLESSTIQAELLEQEADYASVFKSRPKLAMSPTLSPQESEPSELGW